MPVPDFDKEGMGQQGNVDAFWAHMTSLVTLTNTNEAAIITLTGMVTALAGQVQALANRPPDVIIQQVPAPASTPTPPTSGSNGGSSGGGSGSGNSGSGNSGSGSGGSGGSGSTTTTTPASGSTSPTPTPTNPNAPGGQGGIQVVTSGNEDDHSI